MSSGYYSALSGAVSRMQALDVLTNNLANVGTTGFKKSVVNFNSYLDSASQADKAGGINYSFIDDVVPDMSDGQPMETGNPLNLAIMGKGFFKIQNEEGIFYTRQGNFHLDAEGFLATLTGHRLIGEGGPINLDRSDVVIGKNGGIFTPDGAAGKIDLYEFDDVAQLSRVSDGVFRADEVEGQISEKSGLLQGKLEGSNVQVLQEMTQMIAGVRYFESYQKLMKNYSELAAKANQIGILT